MADIRCLICNRVNDASAERCWYCNTLLPRQAGPLTPQERSKLARIRQHPAPPENEEISQPPEGNSTPKSPAPVEREVPEWLERVRQLKQHDEETAKPERRDWVAEEQPQWLRELTGEAPQTTSAAQETTAAPPEEDEGEAGQIAVESETQSNLTAEEPTPDQIITTRQVPFKGDIEAEFDFMEEPAADISSESMSSTRDEKSGESETDKHAESVESEADIIEMLEHEENPTPPEKEPEAEFPIAVEELPDWLADDQPVSEPDATHAVVEAQASPLPEKKIEKAHLPAWLASLRPVHSSIEEAPASEPQPENLDHGILSGIQGTLPASGTVPQIKESRIFGTELSLSPTQRRNADMFRRLLQSTEEDLPIQVEKQASPVEHKLLRWLVTLLVLFSVIIPIFSSAFRGVTPELYSTEVVDALGIVQSLPADTPVMVTAHFEAGLAGELDWTAQPVLKHLVSRRVPLALTSTNVTGFAILQQMIRGAVGEGTDYALDQMVVELGYLPGGAIGLGALVSDPLAALPLTTDIQPVGIVDILKGINSLSDFGALILITDNPDFARAWIEQINQSITPVKTLALVSAQAAPLIQPYYASGQVNGILSGVAGALSYELLRAVPGTASAKFQIYQVAILVAAVIIFAGGIISAMMGSTREGKR